MSKIYVKNTTLGDEKSIILDAREGLIYPLPFKNWTKIKIGMYYSLTTTAGDNLTIVGGANELLQVHGVRDRLFLGLKTTDSLDFPTENNEFFWGYYGNTTHGVDPTNTRFTSLDAGSLYPPSITANTPVAESLILTNYSLTANGSPTSAFASYLGIEFIVNSTARVGRDTMALQLATRSSTAITNVSKEALRNETVTNGFALQASSLVVDKNVLPQALFLYWPLWTYRLRVHSIAAFQTA